MGHTLSPSDPEVPSESRNGVLKIAEALFPEGAVRESYPSDVAPEVPLLQMSELKLAAKRLDSGKASGRNLQRSSESDYSGNASTHSGLTQHLFEKR